MLKNTSRSSRSTFCPRCWRPSSAPTSSTITSSPSPPTRRPRPRSPPRSEAKADPKAVGDPPAAIPDGGVKAKGISEKAILEKTATEKPAVVDKPAETASLPAETRRHQPAPREKAVAKAAAPAPVPVSRRPPPPPRHPRRLEAAVAPEEKRDANDLARAAIERLRGDQRSLAARAGSRAYPGSSSRPGGPRRTSCRRPPVQPLPPPIMVSTPRSEAFNPATGSCR